MQLMSCFHNGFPGMSERFPSFLRDCVFQICNSTLVPILNQNLQFRWVICAKMWWNKSLKVYAYFSWVYVSLPIFFLSCPFLCTNEGIANESKKLYGAQFHPEVSLTVNGKMILKNFLYDIAGCSGTFTVENRELQCIQDIKEKVGSSKVLVSRLNRS